ncbi:hypothetical protein GCM10022222_59820 [Amycolatopsis ultiminotia]|uniref:Enamine deaminase RidA, house cleaning of reactive enamine intermediates, YjgF/YER057c/UK114 family n=1 Tax=Amycolatopsis ultiminotia TaxID=543629 RepID=A0ABP6XJW3_9PSEU
MPAVGHSYLRTRRAGDLLHVAGQTPKIDGKLVFEGIRGQDVDIGTARRAAESCAIDSLASIAAEVDLDDVSCLAKATAFVASDPRFDKQAVVADAASDLLLLALGERGRPARTTIGVASLPGGAPVEIEVSAWCPAADPDRDFGSAIAPRTGKEVQATSRSGQLLGPVVAGRLSSLPGRAAGRRAPSPMRDQPFQGRPPQLSRCPATGSEKPRWLADASEGAQLARLTNSQVNHGVTAAYVPPAGLVQHPHETRLAVSCDFP